MPAYCTSACKCSKHAGCFLLCCCICILQPFSCKDGWREGSCAVPSAERWMKEGWAEGWCRENKGCPGKNCRDRQTERKEKPREAPLQLLCTGGGGGGRGSPLLFLLSSLHAAAYLIKTTARLHTECINCFTFRFKCCASPCVSCRSASSLPKKPDINTTV